MCTLSWWVRADACGFLFNRDEKRTRAKGLPPRRVPTADGKAQILMPLDPDAGGSWLGVNQNGLSVAVLNNYPYYQGEIPAPISRGQLVVDLLNESTQSADCMAALATKELQHYRGFLLFAMDRTGPPMARVWNGIRLEPLPLLEDGGLHILTTSSVRREDCETYRQRLFYREQRSRSELQNHHLHFKPDDPALGPVMIREDAATDSFTEVILHPDYAEMRFQSIDGIPPRLAEPVIETLPLKPAK